MASQRYAFTVTLKPVLYKLESEEQYDGTFNELKRLLSQLALKLTLIAEHTVGYCVHYHGIITFTLHGHSKRDVKKRFYDLFRCQKLFGFVNIKAIENEPGWVEYISKSFEQFKFDADRRPIIIDQHEIYDTNVRADYAIQWDD